MHRRQFLTSSVAIGSLAMAPRVFALPPEHPYMQKLGLQLYTVRNQLAENQQATIADIAEAGYRQIELMDVLKDAPLVAMAKDNGMTVTSAFFDWQIVVSPEKEGKEQDARLADVIEKANELGIKHLVFGYIGKGHRETLDHYRKIADSANRIGEKIKSAGMQMNYHNHSFEFETLEDESMGYEIFLDRFDPALIGFEFDVFWAAIGGWNPLEILRRLDKRALQLHLKDIRPGTGTIYDEGQVPHNAFQEVGDGSIMFRELLALAQELGVEQCHVEQDQSPNPYGSICQSFAYIRDMEIK